MNPLKLRKAEFKVGDTVRCLRDAGGNINRGAIGKVIGVDNENDRTTDYSVDFPQNHDYTMSFDEMELVKGDNKITQHKYTKTYTRDDGVVFTKDTIEEPGFDELTIEEMTALTKTLTQKTKKLMGLLNSHKRLSF